MKDTLLKDMVKKLADADIDVDEIAEMLEEEYDRRDAEKQRKEEIAAAVDELANAIIYYYEIIFETEISKSDEEYLRKRLNSVTAEMLKVKAELDKVDQASKNDAGDAFQNWFREMGLN